MTDPRRKLEQISDFGDLVGTGLGKYLRIAYKYLKVILVITIVGSVVFLYALISSTFKTKKENEEYNDL
jgi:phage shock protein PspC (stress-responsive transcriptional regulator)